MTYRQILQKRAIKNNNAKVLGSLTPHQVILAPVITEKTHKGQESGNKYVFKVHLSANKNDVKQSIKSLYNVVPSSVNIVNVVSKWRMQRSLVRRAYKKAIVTLEKKDKIELV